MSANPDFQAPPDPPAAEGGGRDVGDSLESRLTRLETHLQYLATKEDIQILKTHLQYFATKEDLQYFATKEDLRYFATKEDIQTLKTHLQYFATKEDIQKLKVWGLGGILGGMGLAATIAVAVLRLSPTVAG